MKRFSIVVCISAILATASMVACGSSDGSDDTPPNSPPGLTNNPPGSSHGNNTVDSGHAAVGKGNGKDSGRDWTVIVVDPFTGPLDPTTTGSDLDSGNFSGDDSSVVTTTGDDAAVTSNDNDAGAPPDNTNDAGTQTPPSDNDSGNVVPPVDTPPSDNDAGTPPVVNNDSGNTAPPVDSDSGFDNDAGTTAPPVVDDAGTPPVDNDSGTPPTSDNDSGSNTPPPSDDAGSPPPPSNDSGTPPVDVCSDRNAPTCVHSQGYFKNTTSVWSNVSLTIGGVTYTQAQLLALLNTPSRGDASVILVKQLIATLLNGGDCDVNVKSVVVAAQDWMTANKDADGVLPYNVNTSTASGAVATALGQTLDQYNNGNLGTPYCK